MIISYVSVFLNCQTMYTALIKTKLMLLTFYKIILRSANDGVLAPCGNDYEVPTTVASLTPHHDVTNIGYPGVDISLGEYYRELYRQNAQRRSNFMSSDYLVTFN